MVIIAAALFRVMEEGKQVVIMVDARLRERFCDYCRLLELHNQPEVDERVHES